MNMLILLVNIGGWLLQGWAFTKVWNWFVVTHFGTVSMNIPMALGLSLLFGVFSKYEERDESERIMAAVYSVLAPFLVIILAWVVLQFV